MPRKPRSKPDPHSEWNPGPLLEFHGNPYGEPEVFANPADMSRELAQDIREQQDMQRAEALSESQFQSEVVMAARLAGWVVYHTHNSRGSQPGFPDLVMAHPQLGVRFVELKSQHGKVTDWQKKWLADLVLAGAKAEIWRPIDLYREPRRIYRILMGEEKK